MASIMETILDVDCLSQTELMYEVANRGGDRGDTEAKLRKELKILMMAEKNTSFQMPTHPFTFEEDKTALTQLVAELQPLISHFTGSRSDYQYNTVNYIQYLFNHIKY